MLSRSPRAVRSWSSPVLRLVPGLLVVLSAGASQFALGGEAPIPWRTDFDAARTEARLRGRPLWVQFTGAWCLFCQKMDRETFSQSAVVALSRDDFIPVKVRSDEREDLVERYAVEGLPATVILAPDGRVVGRREGFAEADEFLAFLFASRPPRADDPAGEIALAGYDPVSLVSGNGLSVGRPTLVARHDGLEYRFADEADREEFLRHPERFLPSNRGRCAVSLVDRGISVGGDPRFGVYFRGRLYLCADDAARRRFAAEPERYSDADLGDAGQCPHCRMRAGRLVPGLPQFSLIHQGRRYLFPDRVHLEAFRQAPETYVR